MNKLALAIFILFFIPFVAADVIIGESSTNGVVIEVPQVLICGACSGNASFANYTLFANFSNFSNYSNFAGYAYNFDKTNIAYLNQSQTFTENNIFDKNVEINGDGLQSSLKVTSHALANGIEIDGVITDGFVIGGITDWTGINNIFGALQTTILYQPTSRTGLAFWGQSISPRAFNNATLENLDVFRSQVGTNNALLGAFTGTIRNTTILFGAPNIENGNWNNLNLIRWSEQSISSSANVRNITVIEIGDVTNGRESNNSIKTGNGTVSFHNNKINTSQGDGTLTAARYFENNQRLCKENGTNCPSGGNSSWNQSLADTLYLTIDPTTGETNQIVGLETGTISDITSFIFPGIDPGAGYAQAFTGLDMVIQVATYLGTTTFGQPARRIDTTTVATHTTTSDFTGTLQVNAASSLINITWGSSTAGRESVVRKMDASANVVRVKCAWYDGTVEKNLTAQYAYMVIQYNGTRCFLNGAG